MKTQRIFFRVIYGSHNGNYSDENFNTLDEAIKRRNQRNIVREADLQPNPEKYTAIWLGDLGVIHKIVETSEPVKMFNSKEI